MNYFNLFHYLLKNNDDILLYVFFFYIQSIQQYILNMFQGVIVYITNI